MKTILAILLIAVISISASVVTTSVIATVKPATPKMFYVHRCLDIHAQDVIAKKYRDGYILKCAMPNYQSVLIVMEKY